MHSGAKRLTCVFEAPKFKLLLGGGFGASASVAAADTSE
jgi:hypothetical protein